MSTSRTFQAMLNEHLNYELLKEEMMKRDYILNRADKDDGWLGGTLPVPFKAAGASSVSFGSLTASNDIGEDVYVRGSISTQPEVWGSMLFNHRDLMEHDKISEKNFLKILPDAVDDFLDYVKMVVSLSFTNGSFFAKASADGDSSGNITVDRPERFVVNQKVAIKDDDSAEITGYVKSIIMDTGVINIVTTRGGSTVVDLSSYTVAQNAKIYFDNSRSNSLTSLRSSLLSSANGGSTTLYGQTKTAYPYLQAINVSGSSVTAVNILDKIFDAYTVIKNRGKGKPNEILMSYKHLGSILKSLEVSKGPFNVVAQSEKTTVYGWTEIQIQGVSGVLKLIAVQEMDDDYIMFIDWRAIKIHSNGFFRKRKSPDGIEYFEVRATSGYQYIIDICFFGDLVLSRPSYCGIMYSISY
jgi:hypothetical protein